MRERLSLRVLREDLARAIALLQGGAAAESEAAEEILAQLARLDRLVRDAKLAGRLLDVLEEAPGLTGSGVALAARAHKPEALATLKRLEAAGALVSSARGTQARVWHATGSGGANRFGASEPVGRVEKLIALRTRRA